MEGQAQELGGEGGKEAHVLVFEVSLESLFPPLSAVSKPLNQFN